MQPPCAKKAIAVLNYGHTAQLAHDRSHVYDKKSIIIIKKQFLANSTQTVHGLEKDNICNHSCAKEATAARNRDSTA